MAIIPQKQLFGWKEIENIGGLERLRLVIEYLPDEKLVQILEIETHARGRKVEEGEQKGYDGRRDSDADRISENLQRAKGRWYSLGKG